MWLIKFFTKKSSYNQLLRDFHNIVNAIKDFALSVGHDIRMLDKRQTKLEKIVVTQATYKRLMSLRMYRNRNRARIKRIRHT